jgi:GNAT superfamily N-acetyltransferase
LDRKLESSLEHWLGYPIDVTPGSVQLKSSANRSEHPFNHFVLNMVIETCSVQISTVDRLFSLFSQIINENSAEEIFSDFGIDQIRILLGSEKLQIGTGYSYQLNDRSKLRKIEHHFEFQTSLEESGTRRFEYHAEGQLAGWAEVYARDSSGCFFVDVETHELFRGRGIAIALVHDATKFILEQGNIARYGAEKSNFVSLRIAKKLGYRLCSQHIVG